MFWRGLQSSVLLKLLKTDASRDRIERRCTAPRYATDAALQQHSTVLQQSSCSASSDAKRY